ncbi:hypothetical protein P389DRAFT_38098 [Cystobasidium minutum MCA 4210]|uniref:uncharacterized protein n=1 Tax=Cystobasidium minutum MCA 4210 TaxID=1397322 RepID=UPI0034CF1FF6|eukprot:jgi/Rhomi1/38098/CE38097_370
MCSPTSYSCQCNESLVTEHDCRRKSLASHAPQRFRKTFNHPRWPSRKPLLPFMLPTISFLVNRVRAWIWMDTARRLVMSVRSYVPTYRQNIVIYSCINRKPHHLRRKQRRQDSSLWIGNKRTKLPFSGNISGSSRIRT